MMNRRRFAQYIGAGAVGFALPKIGWGDDRRPVRVPANTGANGRVVVVGGGMAGATAAKYLRLWGGAGVQVTLIERDPQYYTCILSNLILNGSRALSNQTFTYSRLVQDYGVNVVQGDVSAIDPITQKVRTLDGREFAYDKVIVAPGVDFNTIPGLESPEAQAAVPHAWKAGPQTLALRDQIRAMPAGGLFVITIPKPPFRATAAPYDRACIVADYLKRNKPGSKVLVLDANAAILAERATFTNAFNVTYAGVIEYRPGVTLNRIDASTLTLDTSSGKVTAHVINAIPPQQAGRIIHATGLNNANGGTYAAVDVLTYESTAQRNIHVLGDSASTTQPKGGHVGNAQAKVCADAMTRVLRGDVPDPDPVTSSTVFSPISADRASWLSVVFKYDPVLGIMTPVGGAATEAAAATRGNFENMSGWFRNLMADTFA
jgi:NADPH-dependent 2,4-dienoyl-CoA reductase/sulfur reductase-like enzyme